MRTVIASQDGPLIRITYYKDDVHRDFELLSEEFCTSDKGKNYLALQVINWVMNGMIAKSLQEALAKAKEANSNV